jgi:hypothetical protein
VAEDWRILHSEELYTLNTSPSIIRVIKSWRMSSAKNVAGTGRVKYA